MPNEQAVVLHQGKYKRVATLGEAVFLITGSTIGAGMLGLPYVISRVGLKIGIVYLVALSIVVLMLNLMLGETIARTKANLQIPGLGNKYLGKFSKWLLSITFILSMLGALLAYVVGEGQVLAAMFGGSPFMYSLLFWLLGNVVVAFGLKGVKMFEKALSSLVILLIILISTYLFGKADVVNFNYVNFGQVFLPYGVILFALRATPAIAEAEAILPGEPKKFKRAIIIGTLIPALVYILFAVAVVGASGLNTTEVATIGLGKQFGSVVLLVGNIFAALAMGTAFVGLGNALKDTLSWDYKLNKKLAFGLSALIPLTIFILGANSFVGILNVVGGLLVGLEAIFMVLVYWQARKRGDLSPTAFKIHHIWLFMLPVMLVFSIFTLISVIKLF